ncbi:MAG: rhodanese-like domain-containing protein [Panacagrimonas sp.]
MAQFLEFFQNHPGLFAALAVVLTLIVANEVYGAINGGKRLSVTEAVRLINDRDPLVVDLRPAGDFKRGHLMNAVNVPLAKLETRSAEWKKQQERPVLLYCALGNSSSDASARLRKLGFAEPYQIRGGINAWINSSLPITSKS